MDLACGREQNIRLTPSVTLGVAEPPSTPSVSFADSSLNTLSRLRRQLHPMEGAYEGKEPTGKEGKDEGRGIC